MADNINFLNNITQLETIEYPGGVKIFISGCPYTERKFFCTADDMNLLLNTTNALINQVNNLTATALTHDENGKEILSETILNIISNDNTFSEQFINNAGLVSKSVNDLEYYLTRTQIEELFPTFDWVRNNYYNKQDITSNYLTASDINQYYTKTIDLQKLFYTKTEINSISSLLKRQIDEISSDISIFNTPNTIFYTDETGQLCTLEFPSVNSILTFNASTSKLEWKPQTT